MLFLRSTTLLGVAVGECAPLGNASVMNVFTTDNPTSCGRVRARKSGLSQTGLELSQCA